MSREPPPPLRRIEQRLSAASDAAERLIAESARAARGDRPPPAGWQVPPGDDDRGRWHSSELELLLTSLRLLGDVVPSEVRERLAAALRELLLALRALIDYYLERLERPRREQQPHVRDIPIE